MKLRTFIALELPELHKQGVVNYLNTWSRSYTDGINWVKPENLHLTMLFIGETQSGDIAQIQAALFELMLKTESFELSCLGFELFPAVEPRLLWVKLDTPDRGIFTFAKELNRTVRQFGYTPDAKALKLHITVGRIKARQPVWMEVEFLRSELPKQTALYDTVTFYQSVLKPDGPVYTPLEQYTLRRKI
jgi:RNA 2',3'-cyclic 3'-phosphodiesterase